MTIDVTKSSTANQVVYTVDRKVNKIIITVEKTNDGSLHQILDYYQDPTDAPVDWSTYCANLEAEKDVNIVVL